MKANRIACADFTFPLLQHDNALDIIAMLECEGVDIGLFSDRSHLRPETELSNVKRNAKALRTKLDDRGLVPSDVYLQLSQSPFGYAINHPDQRQRQYSRDYFVKLIEYAVELGADHISCLPGMHFPHESRGDSLGRSLEELIWRVERTKGTGLSFGVEAHIGSLFVSPEQTEWLISLAPGLTLTLDYTHFIYNGYQQHEIDPLAKYASHFHARGASKNRLQTSMMQNVIDYTKVIGKLKEVNYKGWLGLEYIWTEWERCNNVDNISETIRLRNIIASA